jgi:hypothetical protein
VPGHRQFRNCRAEERAGGYCRCPRPTCFWRDPSYPRSSLAMMTILRPSISPSPWYRLRTGAKAGFGLFLAYACNRGAGHR